MRALATVAGLAMILLVLWETFETIVLPRRIHRALRMTRLFYRWTWAAWSTPARAMRDEAGRELYLSFYGPLSLLLLVGVWAVMLVVGFALLHVGLGTDIATPEQPPRFGALLYLSGTTFFTLGFGDLVPRDSIGRATAVIEAGTGLAFLALVIGYLPVLYQAFSRREISISLLDARAGSPPSAGELLRRCATGRDNFSTSRLDDFLHDWERWAAEVLESQLSFPLLGFYRSQHEHQSWLAALTTILDTCAVLLALGDGGPRTSARLTFAMARHAAVDLSQVFGRPPHAPSPERLSSATLAELRQVLAAAGMSLRDAAQADSELARLRATYEPFVNALSVYLLTPLPTWLPTPDAVDDWEETP